MTQIQRRKHGPSNERASESDVAPVRGAAPTWKPSAIAWRPGEKNAAPGPTKPSAKCWRKCNRRHRRRRPRPRPAKIELAVHTIFGKRPWMRGSSGPGTVGLPHSWGQGCLSVRVEKPERRTRYGNQSDGTSKSCVAGGMAGRAQGAAKEGEGVFASSRPVEQAAPRSALGEGGEGVRVRWPKGEGDACGSLRRQKPVDCVPLHARSRVGGRMPELLVHLRPH